MKMRGFTLIELMIVVAIFMILAAIILPAVLGKNGNAQQRRNQNIVNNLTYFRDPKTDICYVRDTYNDRVLSTVDCDKVRDQLR